MILNDGFEMDDKLRVVACPKCGNEQMSDDAQFCRICGGPLYNLCEGVPEYDNYGNIEDRPQHKCHGNSRFCEKCGSKTTFLTLGYLFPFEKIQEKYYDEYFKKHPEATGDRGAILGEENFPQLTGVANNTFDTDVSDLPF